LCRFGKILLLIACLSVYSFPSANALPSSINDVYEITIYYTEGPFIGRLHGYGPRSRFGDLAISFTIRLSIQTEYDGTWKGTNQYAGLIEAFLEWYDHTLFPYGIEIIIEPDVYWPTYPWWQTGLNAGENVTFYGSSFSIGDSPNVFDHGYVNMLITPVPPHNPPYNVPLQLSFWCHIYNGTQQYGSPMGSYIYHSQLFNIARMPAESITSTTISNEAILSIKNLVYVLIALVATLITVNLVQFLYMRKWYTKK
jgi:hypothetical protein